MTNPPSPRFTKEFVDCRGAAAILNRGNISSRSAYETLRIAGVPRYKFHHRVFFKISDIHRFITKHKPPISNTIPNIINIVSAPPLPDQETFTIRELAQLTNSNMVFWYDVPRKLLPVHHRSRHKNGFLVIHFARQDLVDYINSIRLSYSGPKRPRAPKSNPSK